MAFRSPFGQIFYDFVMARFRKDLAGRCAGEWGSVAVQRTAWTFNDYRRCRFHTIPLSSKSCSTQRARDDGEINRLLPCSAASKAPLPKKGGTFTITNKQHLKENSFAYRKGDKARRPVDPHKIVVSGMSTNLFVRMSTSSQRKKPEPGDAG